MAHDSNTSSTSKPVRVLFNDLEKISLAEFERQFKIAGVYNSEDWPEILDVDQTCIWVVLMVNDRKVTDGSSMVIATISPEQDTIFGNRSAICYFRTEQVAANYLVELTITDMITLGMNLSPEIISALKVLDAMNSDTDRDAFDRDMRPVGWDLGRIRQAAKRIDSRLGEYVNPYADKNRTIRRHLRNVGRAALDLSIELLPYARVFIAGVVFGRLIEAGAREAAEQAGK